MYHELNRRFEYEHCFYVVIVFWRLSGSPPEVKIRIGFGHMFPRIYISARCPERSEYIFWGFRHSLPPDLGNSEDHVSAELRNSTKSS
jgi:hypothetical protein